MSTVRACAADGALQLFLHDLLQDVTVQREIRDQVLKLAVLLAQLPELAQLAQAQPRILLLPNNGMDGAPSPSPEWRTNSFEREVTQMKVHVLGVDLAKNVFQLHGIDRKGRPTCKLNSPLFPPAHLHNT